MNQQNKQDFDFDAAWRSLTPRQKEVAEKLLDGVKTQQELAKLLGIARVTVGVHCGNIYSKFGISTESEFILLVRNHQLGLLKSQSSEQVSPESVKIVPPEMTEATVTETAQQVLPDFVGRGSAIAEPIKKDDPNFVGRESAITTLNELSQVAKVILIQGAGGVGKTALARNYLAAKFGDKTIEFLIARETKDISPIEGILEQSLRSLGEEPGRDFGVSLLRLKEKLQTQAMGVLIDNLEPALDRTGRLIEAHRRYLELLRILADPTVKSITLITSREALGETLDISLYRLPILTLEAWQTYFQNRKILCDIQEIEAIWNAYQGNALAMKLLSERVLLDYSGNAAAFWQEQQKMGVLLTMDNLIKEQFDRLENIDLNAYHLLCRMGCFRYQDVPTVPLEGLFCLLWDVAESQQGQVVNALKSRSLVDMIDGEYQLHPLIRKEAINRLRNSEDWEKANRQSAEFWAKNVEKINTAKDALIGFEGYYHHLALEKWEECANFLVARKKREICFLSMLRSFGFIIKIIEIVRVLIKKELSDFFIQS